MYGILAIWALFKSLSLYLEARIWIRIRICIRLKSRMRIRILSSLSPRRGTFPLTCMTTHIIHSKCLYGRKISSIFSVLNILNIPSIRRWYAWERHGPGRRSSWARVSSPHSPLRSPRHLATKLGNFSARICKLLEEPKESIQDWRNRFLRIDSWVP